MNILLIGRRLLIAAVAFVPLGEVAPPQSMASTSAFEGIPQFGIHAQPIRSMGAAEPIRVLISMSGQYPRDVVAKGVVRLGKKLRWVAGDSAHVGHVSHLWEGQRDADWYVEVQADGTGVTEIRAVMSAEVGGDRVDEMEVLLPVEITDDSVGFGMVRSVRAETVRESRRYRYGGLFLVPIDGPEEVSLPDIKVRPRVVRQESATCRLCPQETTRELPFVVFVAGDGTIISTRFLSEEVGATGATLDMIQSAEAALSRWTFTPGRTPSKPVSDWVIVRVPVRGETQSR